MEHKHPPTLRSVWATSLFASLGLHLAFWAALHQHATLQIPPLINSSQLNFEVEAAPPHKIHAGAKKPNPQRPEVAQSTRLTVAAPLDPTSGVSPATVLGQPTVIAPKDYIREVWTQIQSSLRYPLALQRQGVKGHVVVNLMLSVKGQLLEVKIAQASGHAELDTLAVQAVKNAAPFHALGGTQNIRFTLPFEFRVAP